MRRLKFKPKRGQILILAIVFMAVVLILSASLFSNVSTFLRLGAGSIQRERAVHLVEAGIDYALWRINQNPNYFFEDGRTGFEEKVFGPGDFHVKETALEGGNKKIEVTGYIPSFGSFKQKVKGQVELREDIQETTSTSTKTIIDSDATRTRLVTYCPTIDNCKIVYSDDTTDTVTFVDCNDISCTDRTHVDIDTTAPADVEERVFVDIYCVASDDCKVAYFDSGSGLYRFVDCDSEDCSSRSTVPLDSTTSNVAISLSCPASNDCKIVLRAGSGFNFRDCENETCSSSVLGSSGAGGYPTSIQCIASADCKYIYVWSKESTAAFLFRDCENPSCSTGLAESHSSSGAYTASLYCPSADDCKFVFQRTNYGKEILFVDCANPICSPAGTTPKNIISPTGAGIDHVSLFCPNSNDCKVFYNDGGDLSTKLINCNDASCSSSAVETIDTNTGSAWWQPTATDIFCHQDSSCALLYFDRPDNDVVFINCYKTCSSGPVGTGDWQIVRGTYKFSR